MNVIFFQAKERAFYFLFIVIIVGIQSCFATFPHSKSVDKSKAIEKAEIGGVQYIIPPPWKGNRITSNINPSDLASIPLRFTDQRRIYVATDTRNAFVSMALAASKDGVRLRAGSGYRDYNYQKKLIERRLAKGLKFHNIIQWIAPPGYSEHMRGIAIDMIPINKSFSKTTAYQWLQKNASKFCFEESYPKDSRSGFSWEAWHWKYGNCKKQVAPKPDESTPPTILPPLWSGM